MEGENRYRFTAENYGSSQAGLDWICNIHIKWKYHVANIRPGSELQKLGGQVEVTMSARQGGVSIGKEKIFTLTNGHENKNFKGKLMLQQPKTQTIGKFTLRETKIIKQC